MTLKKVAAPFTRMLPLITRQSCHLRGGRAPARLAMTTAGILCPFFD